MGTRGGGNGGSGGTADLSHNIELPGGLSNQVQQKNRSGNGHTNGCVYDGYTSLHDHDSYHLRKRLNQQQQQNGIGQNDSSSSSIWPWSRRKHVHMSDRPTGTQVHVQALDEIVSVNSFFTVAVFIGLSFTNPTSQANLVATCVVGNEYRNYLLILEVVAFGSYLMSSLIAQGLKLLIVLINGKDHPDQSMSAQINPKFLRFGMFVTALGTIVGTIFLTTSMVILIQIRLGHLVCDSSDWSKWAIIPLVTMVFSGLMAFMSAAVFAFIT